MNRGRAYLDSSAFLKLVLAEAESVALIRWLEAWPERASSRLLRLEALRAVRRHRPDAVDEVRRLLVAIDLISVSDDLIEAAGSFEPLALRSLDAIHIATAMTLADALGALVTYDQRMIEAAQHLGLPVASPA